MSLIHVGKNFQRRNGWMRGAWVKRSTYETMPPCWRMGLHLDRNIYGVGYSVQNIDQNELKKTNDLRISIRISVRGLFTGYYSAAEADSTSDSNAARQSAYRDPGYY